MKPGSSSLHRLYDAGPAQALIDKHDALSYPFQTTFGLADLVIAEGVFCPTLTRVSPLLQREVEYRSHERVLDAFTGSGAFAIEAALHGSSDVVAFDNELVSVRCARQNAIRNGVERVVDVRYGTAEEVLAVDESFDLVIANPPLLPGDSRGPLRGAIFDPGLRATTDFVRRLPTFLAESGRCYLVTSDVLDRASVDLDRMCTKHGMVATLQTKDEYEHETYRVHLIRHA
ncbi:methyltransferase [Kribbella sp. NBC_00359]|uniref:methyltransferase n=1 Tax=Kribbella sp. NBC_00359 TaxID=2975966 RepID=UPI002E2236BA